MSDIIDSNVDHVLNWRDCQPRCAPRHCSGTCTFYIMVNGISPTSQNTLMTKYADEITCSIPVGPNGNDSASEEVENIKVWAEENLMKLQ